MNIPARYIYCVVVTAVLAVIGFLTSGGLLGVGILIGGLVSPLFVGSASSVNATAKAPQPVAAVTDIKQSARSVATSSDSSAEEEQSVPSRAEYAGEVKTIYVGNLPYRANEAAIRKLFSEYGLVLSVRLVKDRDTGKRKGYGFVEMPADVTDAAIQALNEAEYLQRTLKVREANEKKEGLKPEDASALSAEL